MITAGLLRGRAVAARVAHNHKVAGSSPAPATKLNTPLFVGFFACLTTVYIRLCFIITGEEL